MSKRYITITNCTECLYSNKEEAIDISGNDRSTIICMITKKMVTQYTDTVPDFCPLSILTNEED